MKIFIMTDMEGVCGIINREDWVMPGGRYYEEGKKLLTAEVNAAIEGFFNAGADEILVADGHGPGAVVHQLLDERVEFIRGFPWPYPFGLDKSFDAIAWIGQHAKAETEYAHICHTGNHFVKDFRINGISVGEFGQMAMCAASLGVYSIFGAGDRAFTQEAQALVKGIETVEVKRGLTPGKGEECCFEIYCNRNIAAIHISPSKARILIKEGAERALKRFIADKSSFQLLDIKPPYTKEIEYRPGNGKNGYKAMAKDDNDIIKLMNTKEIII